MSINIIIADDHPIFRKALVKIIQGVKEVKKVFEANDGFEVIQILDKYSCLIVLLDLDKSPKNGEQCIKVITFKYPATKVIVMSISDNVEIIRKMYDLGCMGYLLKTEDKEEIIKSITDIRQGKRFYSNNISEILLKEEKGYLKSKLTNEIHFSEQELIILKAICAGMSNNDISTLVLRSPRTVERYRQDILNKANVKNPLGLFRFALKNNLIIED